MRSLPLVLASFLAVAACSSPPAPMPDRTGGPLMLDNKDQGGTKDSAKAQQDKADKRAEELADKQKQLQQKQRDLEYAKVEQENAAIDRQTRSLTLSAGLDKAKFELDKAKRALELFRTVEQPKELEERLISHQYAVNSADQAQDELAELEAMYQAEEFAKSTKELVIKRGRQRLELAQRSLAVSKTGLDLLKEHTLPDKLKDLERKVADAERDLKKVELEGRKADIELALAERKAKDRIADLERDIAELQQKLEKMQRAEGGS